MLIHGLVTIQDWSAPESGAAKRRPLRSCLLTKKVGDSYLLCVKNSMYPMCINYLMVHLDQVFSKFVAEGKLTMKFKEPRHMVLVHADDAKMLAVFLRQIRDIVSGKDVVVQNKPMPRTVPKRNTAVNPYDPVTTEFVAIERFDQRILNMRQLRKLVMENCVLPNLPVHIGHLPIVYLSLSGSKLGMSQYDRDTLWDWMTVDTIDKTLTTLKMDAIGLQTLPFEIMHLKKLQTLSIAKNKLTYLPHYIGEMKKLHSLSVADNTLNYIPDSFFPKTFDHLDISNNPFAEFNSLILDHIYPYISLCGRNEVKHQNTVKPLSHLSFNYIMQHQVKFKRQEIPRSIWYYFDVVGRCDLCEKFILPGYSVVRHSSNFPAAHCLIKNHESPYVQWQSFVCRFKCSKLNKNA